MLSAITRNGKWERTDRLDRLCWRLGPTFFSLNRRLDYFRDRWFPRAEATDIALKAYPAKKGTAKPAEKAQGEVAPPMRMVVEGAEAVASDAPAVKGKVRVAERLDAAALNQAKPHELVGDAGVVRHQNAMSREYYGTTPIRYTPGFYMHCFPMRLGMGAKKDFHDKAFGPEGAPISSADGKPVQLELELN